MSASNLTIDITGIPEALAEMRTALANMLREEAEAEADPRLARKLLALAADFEVGGESIDARHDPDRRPAGAAGCDQYTSVTLAPQTSVSVTDSDVTAQPAVPEVGTVAPDLGTPGSTDLMDPPSDGDVPFNADSATCEKPGRGSGDGNGRGQGDTHACKP